MKLEVSELANGDGVVLFEVERAVHNLDFQGLDGVERLPRVHVLAVKEDDRAFRREVFGRGRGQQDERQN